MARHGERRTHDAAKARIAILAASAREFSEHGFAASHMQRIADAAGYDKSLLFQYFGDKLGLYTATIESVIRQATPAAAAAQLAALIGDPDTPRDTHKLTTLIATLVRGNFDALSNSAIARRLLAWEAAEGWRTFAEVYRRYTGPGGAGPSLISVLRAAGEAGPVNRELDIPVLMFLLLELPRLYLTELPRLSLVLDNRQLATEPALARARDQLVDAVVRAVLVSPPMNTEPIEPNAPPARPADSN